jgi:Cu(I)/Ag(I) efflux system membrane fusion protein
MNRVVIGFVAAMALLVTGTLAGCGEVSTEQAIQSGTQAGDIFYGCSMHPEVLEDAPGKCPICGMDLVPVGGSGKSKPRTDAREIAYWVAPMDPEFVSDKPGKSPMGMDLIPVYADEGRSDDGRILIDPTVVQNMGVRAARISRRTLFRHVRTIGEVQVAEDKLSVVNLRFSGWVEKIYADKTGEPVEAGDPLFDIYSPSLVAAQKEYLLARRTQGAESSLAVSARRKLELWNLGDRDIDGIVRDGAERKALPIRAPRSGFIIKKSIVEGARVEEGKDLYHIGDLSKVWVIAEVYEQDAPWVEVGQDAQMELTYSPGQSIKGSVAYVYPTIEKSSRTLRVRLEFDNPDNQLKPGMFATVYIQFQRRDDVLVVPTEAIIHSGLRQLVFTTDDDGRFESHEIVTGLVGDRDGTEVISGLEEGDLVVVSGQFLLDSESQLQEARQKMLATRKADAATRPPDPEAHAHWFCPMHPEVVEEETGRCRICGMNLEKVQVGGGHP